MGGRNCNWWLFKLASWYRRWLAQNRVTNRIYRWPCGGARPKVLDSYKFFDENEFLHVHLQAAILNDSFGSLTSSVLRFSRTFSDFLVVISWTSNAQCNVGIDAWSTFNSSRVDAELSSIRLITHCRISSSTSLGLWPPRLRTITALSRMYRWITAIHWRVCGSMELQRFQHDVFVEIVVNHTLFGR